MALFVSWTALCVIASCAATAEGLRLGDESENKPSRRVESKPAKKARRAVDTFLEDRMAELGFVVTEHDGEYIFVNGIKGLNPRMLPPAQAWRNEYGGDGGYGGDGILVLGQPTIPFDQQTEDQIDEELSQDGYRQSFGVCRAGRCSETEISDPNANVRLLSRDGQPIQLVSGGMPKGGGGGGARADPFLEGPMEELGFVLGQEGGEDMFRNPNNPRDDLVDPARAWRNQFYGPTGVLVIGKPWRFDLESEEQIDESLAQNYFTQTYAFCDRNRCQEVEMTDRRANVRLIMTRGGS